MSLLARPVGLGIALALLIAVVACTADAPQSIADAGASRGDVASAAPPASSHTQVPPTAPAAGDRLVYSADGPVDLDLGDIPRRALEFMTYHREIQLTSAQERVRREALAALPAPCCAQFTAYTCCCECNLARTIWGLSKHLIANLDQDADRARDTVASWIDAVNPEGYTGNACFSAGGCARRFAADGCGGMAESQLSWS